MAFTYIAVNPQNGQRLAPLANMSLSAGAYLTQTIGKYEQASFNCPYPVNVIAYANKAPVNGVLVSQAAAFGALSDWRAATLPGGSVIIALDEIGNPAWGGWLLRRTRTSNTTAQLDCVTMEGYFDRRYAGAYSGSGIDQNQVFSDLITQFVKDGAAPGLPIRVVYTPSPTGTTQTVAYADNQDLTLYSIGQTLAGSPGGIQWTVTWEHQSSPERYTPVLTIADRIGGAKPPTAVRPNALFSMPGCVSDFTLIEDYSTGQGANLVTEYDTGQALTNTDASASAANFMGRPTVEFRESPTSSSSSIQLTLSQVAAARVAAMANGSQSLAISAPRRTTHIPGEPHTPIYGVDFNLGDDVGYSLLAPGFIDGELTDMFGQCVSVQMNDTALVAVTA